MHRAHQEGEHGYPAVFASKFTKTEQTEARTKRCQPFNTELLKSSKLASTSGLSYRAIDPDLQRLSVRVSSQPGQLGLVRSSLSNSGMSRKAQDLPMG